MTKYTTANQRRRATPREEEIHAIWRGIGCLLILIVPTMSYFLAVASVQLAVDQNWPMPYQLMGYPVMPDLLWKAAGLTSLLAFIQSQDNLYAVLAITLVYVVIFSALVSVIYAFVYRYVGPSRYGPQDAPPPKVKVKRYKR
jgi:hypothetical protein